MNLSNGKRIASISPQDKKNDLGVIDYIMIGALLPFGVAYMGCCKLYWWYYQIPEDQQDLGPTIPPNK